MTSNEVDNEYFSPIIPAAPCTWALSYNVYQDEETKEWWGVWVLMEALAYALGVDAGTGSALDGDALPSTVELEGSTRPMPMRHTDRDVTVAYATVHVASHRASLVEVDAVDDRGAGAPRPTPAMSALPLNRREIYSYTRVPAHAD